MQHFGALHLTVMTGARFYKYLAAMQPVTRVRVAIRNARFSQHFDALHLTVMTGARVYKYLATL